MKTLYVEEENNMYKVYAKIKFGYDDVLHCEYSGIEHETMQAAEAELTKAKLHEIDNDDIYYLYIEED